MLGGGVAYAAYADPCSSLFRTSPNAAQAIAYERCRFDSIEAKLDALAKPAVTTTVTQPAQTTTATVTVTAAPTTVTVTASSSSTSTSSTTTSSTTSTTTPPPASAWPDATNTGAKGALTVVNGNTEITASNVTLSNMEYRGEVRVYGTNVTLRNVKIATGGFWALRIDGSGFLIEDSTIVGGPDTQSTIVSGSASWTGRRLDLSGAGDGIKMGSNATLVDSWIHDLDTSPTAHNDGIEITGATNVRVEHNSILNSRSQTSAVMFSEYYGTGDANAVLTNNLLGGGGFTVYGGLEAGKTLKTGITVTNNKFTTRFFPDSGSYGPLAYWDSRNTWTGNTWVDGPRAGQPLTP
jgi:hypothetical protein